ncbi:VanW family protein [Bacillus piscicola]|uniref:VanW family protein n=1 Tax=Bacillus piscicola TaxID=1632684 RepID=UPI001F08EF9C|nr:VanW family protein [Bacillus piscicola]
MKRNRYIERAFLILVTATLLISVVSAGGAAAYEAVWNGEERLPPDTVISGVAVGGLPVSKAETKLQQAVKAWQKRSPLTLALFDERVPLKGDAVVFQVEESVRKALQGGKFPVKAELSEEEVKVHAEHFPYAGIVERTAVSPLTEEIMATIDLMDGENVVIDVAPYVEGLEKQTVMEVTTSVDAPPAYFREWVKKLDGYQMDKESEFSLLQALEESGASLFDDPAADILATAFFQLLGETNFILTERHIHDELPNYADLGGDADVRPDEKDLRFYNPNIYSYQVNVGMNGNELTLSLSGYPFLNSYTIKTINSETISPRTIVRFNPSRVPGDRVTLKRGENGHYTELVKETRDRDGILLREEIVAQDYYPPIHRLEEWSLQEQNQLDDEIPESDWGNVAPPSGNPDEPESDRPGDRDNNNGNDDHAGKGADREPSANGKPANSDDSGHSKAPSNGKGAGKDDTSMRDPENDPIKGYDVGR